MLNISILIVDDHPIVRSGLRSMLQNQSGFDIVAEAEDGEDAIVKVQHYRPMIAIMDIAMPKLSGIEATRIIAKKYPQTRVMILTMHDDEAYLGKIIEAGASGFLLKDCKNEEIVKAIQRVAEGEKYFSQSAYQLLGKQFSRKNKPAASEDDEAFATLTAREREVLTLVAEGLNTHEIAKKLFLSPRTVDTHRSNLMHKLRIHNATALVRYAIERGLVQNES